MYFCIGISSTLYPWQYIMLQAMLDKETEKHLKAPVFPLVCVSNLCAERKAVLGNRRFPGPVQRVATGFEVSLIARVEPAKRATAVSSRAAEMEARPLRLGGGRHNRPPFGGSHRSASEEPFEWHGSFKTWKSMLDPAVLPNVLKPSLHMSKQQTQFCSCCYFCGSARTRCEILQIPDRTFLLGDWEQSRAETSVSAHHGNMWLLLKIQCLCYDRGFSLTTAKQYYLLWLLFYFTYMT